MTTKCDRSKVMKRAWRFYENDGYKGVTFSECLKNAWKIEKREVNITVKAVEYYNEVCMKSVERGEDAVYDDFRVWQNKTIIDPDTYTIQARAWKMAKSNFSRVGFTIGVVGVGVFEVA